MRVEVGVRLIFGKVEVFRIVDAGQFALLWGKFGTKRGMEVRMNRAKDKDTNLYYFKGYWQQLPHPPYLFG